ncbi:hypothetical protein M8J77_017869 [Diaphorina citri]|nr:hypothetical protein M8J77_017869 [Diaphorina citri]
MCIKPQTSLPPLANQCQLVSTAPGSLGQILIRLNSSRLARYRRCRWTSPPDYSRDAAKQTFREVTSLRATGPGMTTKKSDSDDGFIPVTPVTICHHYVIPIMSIAISASSYHVTIDNRLLLGYNYVRASQHNNTSSTQLR